jgi:hypothetical protein
MVTTDNTHRQLCIKKCDFEGVATYFTDEAF